MSEIHELEENLQRLLTASEDLRARYEASQEREQKLRNEKADLLKKHDLAKEKIETIISRLKELEQV